MDISDDYLDLSTYSDIYSELVYERNETIRWLQDHQMLVRDRRVVKANEQEWSRHKSATAYRKWFNTKMPRVLNRLYHHDATEALYEMEACDLGDWSDTEANRLERELQALQRVIGRLESRYRLQYRMLISYVADEQTLYLNNEVIFGVGITTVRHKLLSALYSSPMSLWENETLEEYFIAHFGFKEGELRDKVIEKAAYDIKKDVSSKIGVKNFLLVSNSSVRINPRYLPQS